MGSTPRVSPILNGSKASGRRMPIQQKVTACTHAGDRAAHRCRGPWTTLLPPLSPVTPDSERLGLIAEIDVLNLADGAAVPVGHKRAAGGMSRMAPSCRS